MNRLLVFFLAMVLFAACSGGTKQTTDVSETEKEKKVFTIVEVPVMYTAPEARAEFVATHYWDNFNFKDTTYANLPEVTEQAWADYLNILSMTSPAIAYKSIGQVIKKAEVDSTMFVYFTSLTDKYLYDANSPMRNEDFYLATIDTLISSPWTDEALRSRLTFRKNMALKNRVGEVATDFTYTLTSGVQKRMSAISSPYLLIFINNPGCHACLEMINELKASPIINQLQEKKQLKVLAIYTDEELDEWKRHQSDMDPIWINGYDKTLTLRDKELYDLKAIPTLYLLNKGKKVLLKDVSFPTLEQFLLENVQGI